MISLQQNMDALIGQKIREYEITEKIGEGGFGVVYKALQPSVGREVAIKVIRPEKVKDTEYIERFEQEAQIISQLEHPHIVPMYNYWKTDESAYLVMRWLSKGNLRTAYRLPDWTLEKTTMMLSQIAGALDAAHKAGIIHRDIKPDNILFDDHDNAYLADFGIAKKLNVTKNITLPGETVGSPLYLSPEQIRKEPPTPQTDIYVLGITLFEALTQTHPFADAKGTLLLLTKQLIEPVPPLHERNPALPSALDVVIRTATEKHARNRYPDAQTLLEEFRRAAESANSP